MTAHDDGRPTGLFVGLSTLDVIQLVERVPDPDEKVVALDVSMAAGGPATNAAVVFAALGGRALLVTRLGDDPAGELARTDLEAHGVEVVDVDPTPQVATPVASILVTASTGERAVVSAAGRNGPGSAAVPPIDASELLGTTRPSVVLIDSYETDVSSRVAQEARERSIPVLLDCGSKKPHTEIQFAHVDAAIVSERYSAAGAAAGAAEIRSHGVSYGAITDGPAPVRFWTPDSDLSSADVPTVSAVDTLGAGDFFHGACAWEIARSGLTGPSFAAAIAVAARVSALSVQEFGSRSWLRLLAHRGE